MTWEEDSQPGARSSVQHGSPGRRSDGSTIPSGRSLPTTESLPALGSYAAHVAGGRGSHSSREATGSSDRGPVDPEVVRPQLRPEALGDPRLARGVLEGGHDQLAVGLPAPVVAVRRADQQQLVVDHGHLGVDVQVRPAGAPAGRGRTHGAGVDVQLAGVRVARVIRSMNSRRRRHSPGRSVISDGRDEDRDVLAAGAARDRIASAAQQADEVLLLHVDEAAGAEDRAQPDVLDGDLPAAASARPSVRPEHPGERLADPHELPPGRRRHRVVEACRAAAPGGRCRDRPNAPTSGGGTRAAAAAPSVR